MVLSGEVREAASVVEAYGEAYSWVEELQASGRTANVHCDGIECHVYAMRMKPTAWNVGRFARRNAHVSESGRSSASCFYVGQTGLGTVEERFNRHIWDGRDRTTWGHHHFLKPFDMAHDDEVRDLIADYASDVGVPMSGLPKGWSLIHEAGFAKWLQKRGHAVISGSAIPTGDMSSCDGLEALTEIRFSRRSEACQSLRIRREAEAVVNHRLGHVSLERAGARIWRAVRWSGATAFGCRSSRGRCRCRPTRIRAAGCASHGCRRRMQL